MDVVAGAADSGEGLDCLLVSPRHHERHTDGFSMRGRKKQRTGAEGLERSSQALCSACPVKIKIICHLDIELGIVWAELQRALESV